MGREELLLAASIQELMGYADAAADDLGAIAEGRGWNFDEPNDQFMEAEDTLRHYLEKLFRDVGNLAERLRLPQERHRIGEVYREAKKRRFAGVQPDPYVGTYSPTLEQVRGIFNSLSIITNSAAITGLDTLKTILENSGRILHDRNVIPQKEKHVQDAVHQVMRYAFNDVVSKPSVAHVLKHYIPDLGVRSLMALVEFKYAHSYEELKAILDGIFADMNGYSGDDQWRNYFAVIYQTGNFSTQGEVAAAFADVKTSGKWVPLLITGRGSRTKATTRVRTHKTHHTIAATRQTEARKFLASLS